MAAVRDTHGGESIVYYGGGGQGNHLGGTYGAATLAALGVRFKANAISQEKTGEMLVMGKMFGTPLRGDFEHCEVAFFPRQEPVDLPRDPSRPHHAQGDRRRSRTGRWS